LTTSDYVQRASNFAQAVLSALAFGSRIALLHMQEAKVMDQTRGILTYVEQNCPGRFHSNIEYVTVAGKYMQGAGLRDKGATVPQKIVGAGYQQVNCDHRGIIQCSSLCSVSLQIVGADYQ